MDPDPPPPPPACSYLRGSADGVVHQRALDTLRGSELAAAELERTDNDLFEAQCRMREAFAARPPPQRRLRTEASLFVFADRLAAAHLGGIAVSVRNRRALVEALGVSSTEQLLQAALEVGKRFGDEQRPADALDVLTGACGLASACPQNVVVRSLRADLHSTAAAVHLCLCEGGDHSQQAVDELVAAAQALVDLIQGLRGLGRRREIYVHAARAIELLDQADETGPTSVDGARMPSRAFVLRQQAELALGMRVTPSNRAPSRPHTAASRGRSVSVALAGCFWGGIGLFPSMASLRAGSVRSPRATSSAPPPALSTFSAAGDSPGARSQPPHPSTAPRAKRPSPLYFAPVPPRLRSPHAAPRPPPARHDSSSKRPSVVLSDPSGEFSVL